MEHPVGIEELPEASRKILSGPAPMKMMAARGLAPVPPPALVSVLYALSYDADEKLAGAAKATLGKLAPPVLDGALSNAELHPAVLDLLAELLRENEDATERLVRHPRLASETLQRIASRAEDALCELIATNEQRLLADPDVIVALYMNRNLRMSTADRIVELAARNGVEPAIPGFRELAAALQNQLIPEAGEEVPSDDLFREAMVEAEHEERELLEGEEVLERTDDGEEKVKEKFEKVKKRLEDMNVSEKVRTALLGSDAQRAMLVRSPIRLIAMAAINSPKMNESEARKVAMSRQVSEDVLRYISDKRDWIKNYQTKYTLCNNPKTPFNVSSRLLLHIHESDLKMMQKSRNVSAALKTSINQILLKRNEKKK